MADQSESSILKFGASEAEKFAVSCWKLKKINAQNLLWTQDPII